MNNKLIKLTKFLLDFMFFAGILTTITVPFSFKIYSAYNQYFERFYISLCVLFSLSGCFAVLIIGQLRKIFKTLSIDDCFIIENVISLRKMGTYSICIALITCARLILYITPAVLIVIIVFTIAGLFSKVLSLVFQKAVNYKLENDLTI